MLKMKAFRRCVTRTNKVVSCNRQTRRVAQQYRPSTTTCFATNIPRNGHNGAQLEPDSFAVSLETSQSKILTTFTFPAALCTGDVLLTGSFNGWKKPFPMRRISGGDDLVRSVLLPPGPTEFKFVTDGEWRYSPRDPVGSDAGTLNNCKMVQVNSNISWRPTSPVQTVFVTGSFLAWSELVPLRLSSKGLYTAYCCLPNGVHFVRFLVDGTWQVSADLPTGTDEDGIPCNVISVNAKENFAFYYNTSWPSSQLQYRLLDSQGCPTTNSCLGPWSACSIPAPKDEDNSVIECGLEFVALGPNGGLDKPRHEETYRVHVPGGYKLTQGVLRPFPQACNAPYMLVSDVDGTMIDDSDEGVKYAKEFLRYWENGPTLCSSILVYNTGRSIGQLTGLLEYRKGKMAVPDAIITAVGTKVFLLNRSATRATANADSWVEAEGWSTLLQKDWNLDIVHSAADRCVRESDQVHWLDHGTEHPHRIALSVHKNVVQNVENTIRKAIEDSGFKAKFIISGSGDYVYMDVLSIHGGKRNAMEYVRGIFGINPSRVVAAGDSGNDILMLEGTETRAIVVGNAQPALLDWTVRQEQTGRIALTDKPLAQGVLEGLARHGFY